MIIAYLGRNVKDYCKNSLKFLVQLEIICPICHGKTTFHNSYRRHVHIGEEIVWIIIYRVKCSRCGKTHAVIPDFIRPYKHYSTCDTELVLRDYEDCIPVEKIETTACISTARRWIKEFKHRGQQAAGALRSILCKHYYRLVSELELVNSKIIAIIERLLDLLPEIESSNLSIGETNIWLTNHLAGFFV